MANRNMVNLSRPLILRLFNISISGKPLHAWDVILSEAWKPQKRQGERPIVAAGQFTYTGGLETGEPIKTPVGSVGVTITRIQKFRSADWTTYVLAVPIGAVERNADEEDFSHW
jgi:hypothetical protein